MHPWLLSLTLVGALTAIIVRFREVPLERNTASLEDTGCREVVALLAFLRQLRRDGSQSCPLALYDGVSRIRP